MLYTDYSEDVTATVDEMAEEIWRILFSQGPLRKEVAFRQSVTGLFKSGMISDPAPIPSSEDHELIEMAFKAAIEYGFLDTPESDCYRAVLTDPEDLEPEDWRMCIHSTMEDRAMSREEAIQCAADWAKRNIGLDVKDLEKGSPIWQHLDAAINAAIRDKDMKQTIFYGVEKLQLIG